MKIIPTCIQDDVVAFHVAMDEPWEIAPCFMPRQRMLLRRRLIEEESKELRAALLWGESRSHIAKEVCDLIYVAVGTLVEMGIDFEAAWAEVQKSNMSKAGGPRRADGKIMKPDNYVDVDDRNLMRPYANSLTKSS